MKGFYQKIMLKNEKQFLRAASAFHLFHLKWAVAYNIQYSKNVFIEIFWMKLLVYKKSFERMREETTIKVQLIAYSG